MKFINIQSPFSEKWLDLCEHVYAALYQAYKKAIDEGDKVAEASLAAALIQQQKEIDKAWENYNEEIKGDKK